MMETEVEVRGSTFTAGVEAEASSNGELKIDGSVLNHLPELTEDTQFEPQNIRRRELMDYGQECFLLETVLSEQECLQLIETGEEHGFEPIGLARDDYRSSKRISFKSDKLSQLLWSRIKDNLTPIAIDGDPHEQHIEGVASFMKGKWVPKDLNNVFRLCKYNAGGHFAPHNDGFFVRTATDRSLQTCMLYLNGNFSGGSTNFIDPSQQLYKGPDGKYCAEEKNILCSVKPEAGLAIIFNHNRLHEGERLGDGEKYILRTDIMYENVSPAQISDAQNKAVELLQEADRLESAGQCMDAMKLYRRAFKLCPELDGPQ